MLHVFIENILRINKFIINNSGTMKKTQYVSIWKEYRKKKNLFIIFNSAFTDSFSVNSISRQTPRDIKIHEVAKFTI